MLPHAYEQPAAILFVCGGALSCFAGYRLFRVVLGLYGFILGAMFASSMMGTTNTVGMLAAAIIGGVAGAAILVFAYFIGVALVGAGFGALVAHIGWPHAGTGDPPAMVVIALAIAGAVAAMLLQRYVIIVSTAFAGAWTIIVGGLAIAGGRGAAHAVSSADVWILYPMAPAPGQRWVPLAWIALGLIGTAVQLGITGTRTRG